MTVQTVARKHKGPDIWCLQTHERTIRHAMGSTIANPRRNYPHKKSCDGLSFAGGSLPGGFRHICHYPSRNRDRMMVVVVAVQRVRTVVVVAVHRVRPVVVVAVHRVRTVVVVAVRRGSSAVVVAMGGVMVCNCLVQRFGPIVS
jgi:hypothetical protein